MLNHKFKKNDGSYYNQRVGRPGCCIDNFYKVTVINVHSKNVEPCSMDCGDCECLLDTMVDKSGTHTNICRSEYGSIHSGEGLYIITVWKTQRV